MIKKFLLIGLLFNAVSIISVASDTDFDREEMRFNREEIKRAEDLIWKVDQRSGLSAWYAKQIYNRITARVVTFMFTLNVWMLKSLEFDSRKHTEHKEQCHKSLEWFRDRFIAPLKDQNTYESNQLAEILERKVQYHRKVLNIQRNIPMLNLEDVVTENDAHIQERIAIEPSFDAKSYIENINVCQNCVGTGKTVYVKWCNIQRKVYEMKSFVWHNQDEAQSMKMARIARNIKAEFEKAGENVEPSGIDQNGIIQSQAELDILMPWENLIAQNSKEQEKILKLINLCQTNDLAHHPHAFGERCQGVKDVFQSLSVNFKKQDACKEQLKCESIVSNIEKRQAEAKLIDKQ